MYLTLVRNFPNNILQSKVEYFFPTGYFEICLVSGAKYTTYINCYYKAIL